MQSKNEVDRVLTALVKNEGHLSPRNAHAAFGNQNDSINRNFLGGPYNPEAVYQYRYFAVTVDASHRVTVVNDNNVYQVNSTKIKSITRKALSDHQDSGSVDVG
ncbi:MAG: hypothetical protein WAX65_04390 [Lactobacillus amylovorus]